MLEKETTDGAHWHPYGCGGDQKTLLTDHDVAAITGRARSTLQKDRLAGGGIPFVRVGRQVRYRPADLATWLAALPTRTSTSGPA